MKYFIKTFGCQQNKADSERISSYYQAQGMKSTNSLNEADYIIINSCMIRESAENRVIGLVRNLKKIKEKNNKLRIILTGCMVGLALKEKTGKYFEKIRTKMPEIDEFLPIEEVGFDNMPARQERQVAYIPISNGCNNFCSYCIVPYTRGKEKSRPYSDIINEAKSLKKDHYESVMLLGQNVNSYGSDLLINSKKENEHFKPTYVKHLGKLRIPTLFPTLLDEIAKMGFENIDFMSSNPWDFSDELIDTIAKNKNITRIIHLPVQSGDDNVLKRMNRRYNQKEYLELVSRLKNKVKDLKITTDIIVGFCGETDREFSNTVELVKKVGFYKAYISMYSPRYRTNATINMKDNVPHKVKKARWLILENLINKPHFLKR